MVVWFEGQKYGFELKWGDIVVFLRILKKIVIMIKEISSQSDHIDLYTGMSDLSQLADFSRF